jgi:hypothetical protein
MNRLPHKGLQLALLLLLGDLSAAAADLLRVPYDYPTLTQACDVAVSGDSIGVYPGHYFEDAEVREGVSIIGMAADSILAWIESSDPNGPIRVLPGSEPVLIENITLWGGSQYIILNQNPNLLVNRCFLYAYDVEGTQEYYTVVQSLEDFTIRNSQIRFLSFAQNLFELYATAHVVLEDCIVRGTAFEAWYVPEGSSFLIKNNTIQGGIAIDVLGGSTNFSVNFVNNIITGGVSSCDPPPDTIEWRYNNFTNPNIWPNCGTQTGNIAADPLLCAPEPDPELDFRLQPDSPCIGAGEDGENMGARVGICWDPASVEEGLVAAGATQLLTIRPNPSHGNTTFRLNQGGGASLQLLIADPTGRIVRRLSGPGEVHWDGCDNYGDRVPGGVYFVRASNGITGGGTAQRVVVIR